MAEPWRSTRVVLETGGWWEVLPEDMDHFRRHAEAYTASKETDPAAKARVAKVWLNHQYAPAWRPYTPVKGLGKIVKTPDSGATIHVDTGEVVEDEAPF